MEGGSDSPVLVVQRSLHHLPFSQHQPLADMSLSVDPTSEHQPRSATQPEIVRSAAMSQPQPPQAVQPSTPSVPSETPLASIHTSTRPDDAVVPAMPAPLSNPSAPSSPSTSSETIDVSGLVQATQPVTPQETPPEVPVTTDSGPRQTMGTTEPLQDPLPAVMESTNAASEAPPPAAPGTPPPPVLVDPVTPRESVARLPAPQTSEPAVWMNIEEDPSAPDEEELKAYEGRMQSISALDVKHHEEIFYPDVDDPEQRPVKKIRLTWTIKGVRGTKDKPNTARVINSPAAFVDGFYWSIRFFPRGNNASALSAYIKCTKKQPKPDSHPPESTFSFVQGGPDTDLSAVKPEAELRIPPPVEAEDVAAHTVENSKPEEDTNRVSVGAQNSGPALASEGADLGEEDEEEDEDEEDWRVSAQIGMIIYNPQEPRTKYDMSSEHQFNKHNDDWGWTNFHGPWADIPRRRPGQHQALLRNDTIAMDAYIRVFQDPTQALWWHESQEYEKCWDSKSLTGYFPMGTPPLYHSPGVAGITSWLLLAPFRKALQNIDTGGWRRASGIKPQPLLSNIQLILYMMRNLKKGENYVNVNGILDLMDMLGETHSDVISFWEAFRRSIELELKDPNAIEQISDIFDSRSEDGHVRQHTEPLQIDVETASSIQGGLEKTLGSLSEKQQFPKFLPVALARDKYDTKLREWKLLYNKVKLDEEIDISPWTKDQSNAKYTLYGFVAHVGERSSGKFYSVLRPNGPGTKWLAFEDGDGNKVFSYTRHRVQEFEGLEGEELKTNKSTRQTAYLVMYIRTDLLTEFLPGALEPYQIASWLQPHLPAPCHTKDEPDEPGNGTYDFETAIEIYSYANGGNMKGCLDMYTLKDVTLTSTPALKLTVPPETTYTELRQKIAKWKDIDNVEKIRLWKMKLGPLGEHVTASMEKVRLHRSINGSGDSVRPLCLWMQLLQTEDQVKLYGDPDPSLRYDPFAKPIFDDEIVITSRPGTAEAALSGDVAELTTDPEPASTTDNAARDATDFSLASPGNDADATLPTASFAENTPVESNDSAAPDAEQDSVAAAVRASVVGRDEEFPPGEPRFSEPGESVQAAPDMEQDAVAEAVDAAVTGLARNTTAAETGQSRQSGNSALGSGDRRPSTGAEGAMTDLGEPDHTLPTTLHDRQDDATSTNLTVVGVHVLHLGATSEEDTVRASLAALQTTTPQAMEASADLVPSSEANLAPGDDADATGLRDVGLTSNGTTSTAAEDQAASEAMIAALIVADLQAIDGEQQPQNPVNVDTTSGPPPPAAAGRPNDPWNADSVPSRPQATIGDIIDIADDRSEGSSANDEPTRPVAHVYGFIQLFDAVKQEFKLHGSFLAQDSATTEATVRDVLGYPEDKEFLVWTRLKSYKTAAIAMDSVFENLDFRSDGFVLIVGDVLSESSKTTLASEGKFTTPEQLSRYIWMSARNHPTQAFTGDITVNMFGGHFYSGPMLRGLYHGPFAKHTAANGQTYEGPYVAGERSGDGGKMIYQNGDVYEGSWFKNEKHGQGTFVEKRTGNKYVGGFENGKRWGKGTTYWEVADEEGDMCQICYSEEIDALFYDCGHVCACVECAKQVDACPICRKNVRHVVRMYRS